MEIYENRSYLDLPGEEWRNIEGSPDNQVSNFGRVRTLTRSIKYGTVKKIKPGIILKQCKTNDGYLYVCLTGKKRALVHRLVANAFIPNPDSYSDVNHLNYIKSDNNVDNLEWCSHKYNMQYGSKNNWSNNGAPKKPVICIETGKRYESSKIAALEYGTTADYIRKCCRGVMKQAGGKTWRYE